MRTISKLAVVAATALIGVGLTACDENQSLPELTLNLVETYEAPYAEAWPQVGETKIFVGAKASAPFRGVCTLRIPAEPIVSGNRQTQVNVPLQGFLGVEGVAQSGVYPAGVNPALVPPGTYESDVNCTGNRQSNRMSVTLLGSTNVLESIDSSADFTATVDQVFTVHATNMAAADCQLNFAGPAPVTGDPAVLTLPVTSAAPTGGVVTSGTAQYDHTQTTLETHMPWEGTLVCPDRENSGIVSVNLH